MSFPPLYLIADPALYKLSDDEIKQGSIRFIRAVEEAIEGGIRFIQYRDKSGERGCLYERAKRLREICPRSKVTLIVNDEIDIAMAVGADGVHLGQGDFPISMARKLLKKKTIIGLSTHDLVEAMEAESAGADYTGFGPIFETQTKTSENFPVGIASIRKIREKVSLPIYAIGGIRLSQAQQILNAGATGVAVASALADTSKEKIREWVTGLHPSTSSESNTNL